MNEAARISKLIAIVWRAAHGRVDAQWLVDLLEIVQIDIDDFTVAVEALKGPERSTFKGLLN